jgi:3-methyladenine DNA glycosylase Tag
VHNACAGIIHAELFEQLQMAKQKGMSFKAVAEARNESAVLALTRAANLYYLVAEQRVLEGRRQLGNIWRRAQLVKELKKLHPRLSAWDAVAHVLKPPEFFTATEVGTWQAAAECMLALVSAYLPVRQSCIAGSPGQPHGAW